MNLIGWIIAGGLAGWVVALACDDDDAALLVDILVGSVGALAGATFVRLLRSDAERAAVGFDVVALFAALCGAVALLGLLRWVRQTLPEPPRRRARQRASAGADEGDARDPVARDSGSM